MSRLFSSAVLIVSCLLATCAQASVNLEDSPLPNWSKIYTGLPQNPDFSKYVETVTLCSGPYALCAFATCRISSVGSETEPAIAECGCYELSGNNLGSPAGMLSAYQKTTNMLACGGSSSLDCNENANVAPTCFAQNTQPRPIMYGSAFDLISTFSNNWPNNATGGGAYKQTCSSGIYTNCYSAGCRRNAKVTADAPDVTCYCPVVPVQEGGSGSKTVFTLASEGASCAGSDGLAVGGTVWNGVGLVELGP